MEAILEKTSREDQQIARTSIAKLEAHPAKVRGRSGVVTMKLNQSDVYLKIPTKAFELFIDILRHMAQGKSITLLPSDATLSTQQAADMLQVSRPHLVKLLETGQIAYTKVGSHRRVIMQDLVAYEQNLRKTRAEQLDFLTQQAQELNLGY
jgi:excisionase family DNA binding protein